MTDKPSPEAYQTLLAYCKKLLEEIEKLKRELIKYRGY